MRLERTYDIISAGRTVTAAPAQAVDLFKLGTYVRVCLTYLALTDRLRRVMYICRGPFTARNIRNDIPTNGTI